VFARRSAVCNFAIDEFQLAPCPTMADPVLFGQLAAAFRSKAFQDIAARQHPGEPAPTVLLA